ncbi:hypothetical protein [Nocardia crassostreae]|uniref:hypothetical protein n=1 Tax=Nocardia crassostreae TaxID=53428 RepID=UPI0012F89A60|nr:hypothetical protein [Nocardia crassostreae]
MSEALSEALCENPGCGGAATDGAFVCADCLSRFCETLSRLPVLYARCGELLQGERTRGLPRAHGGRREGIVLADPPVEARAEIMALVTSWAALVVDEARPPRRPRRTVPILVEFLLAQQNWLAAHPAIVDAIEEFVAVHGLAQGAVEPGPDRIEVGRCDRHGCGQPVYAHLGGSGATSRLVSCAAGHSWQPHQWLALNQRVGHRRRMSQRAESVA